jgi:hypothetical protein
MANRGLDELRSDFERVRDEMDPENFASIIRELLGLPEAERDKRRSEFFEALEENLHMLYLSYGGGTLTEGEREKVFGLLRENLKPNREDDARSSLQSISGLLIPHPGVKDWLADLANQEKDPGRKSFLSKYAGTSRDDFVI